MLRFQHVLMIAAGGIILGGVVYHFQGKQHHHRPTHHRIAHTEKGDEKLPVATKERAKLEPPLQRPKPKKSLEEALELVKSPSDVKRKYAATLLGKYPEPEAVRGLTELLQDEKLPVRTRAIEALGTLPSPEKTKLLSDISQNMSLSQVERIAALKTLLKKSFDPDVRSQSVSGLISEYRAPANDKLSPLLIVRLLTQHAGDDPSVESFIAEEISKTSDPRLQRKMKSYLSQHHQE